MPHPSRLLAAIIAGPLLLCGCTLEHPKSLAAVAPSAPPPRPELPTALVALKPPPSDGAGGYRTINSGVVGDRAVWHVRAALNVAAIACRGPQDAGLVGDYNAMLASKKALLASADRAFVAAVKDEGGDGDAAMTRLYNFFAMPAAKPGFCAAARELSAQAAATPSTDFVAFAGRALPRIEAPFLAVYREIDAYRMASAAWDARYARGDHIPTELAGSAGGRQTARPQLAYADLDAVFAWTPRNRTRLATR